MAPDASLGASLRRLRTAAGLTQEELAERAGISVRAISDIERGLRRFVYRDTAVRLADALGLDDQLRADFEATARGRGGSAKSPTVQGSSARGAIPVQPTKLIGRDAELDLVLRSLSDADIHLLTITGPGGIGKTRVAAEAAARAQVLFPDGVLFIQLAAVERSDLVPATIAGVLGLDPLVEPTPEAIAHHLGSKRALLVLDTFEHVLDGAPGVTELLARCANVKIVVTSREALRVRPEHVMPLASLLIPADAEAKSDASPAVELFMERARAANPDLHIDDGATAVVRDICMRLGGLPLAIELAAARTRHLSIAALRERLTTQLNILAAGPRDLPQRQRTMRDAIAWSYDLLDDTERSLFRVVAAFAGGCTLDAVTTLWEHESDAEVFDLLSALTDKSLVVVSQDQEPRYTMLDVIAEFGREVAGDPHETLALARRHCGYFTVLAERAEPEYAGSDSDLWYQRLALEHGNVRKALRWAVSEREAELATRLAGAMWQFWRARGHYSEGRTWLRQVLALEGASDTARAKALWGTAWLALHQGDVGDADRWSKELSALAERAGDALSTRNALTLRGMIALSRNDVQEALRALVRSEAICAELGPSWLLATSKLNLALALVHAQRPGDAYPLLDEAQTLYLDLGDHRFAARTDAYRGYAALAEGRPDRARDFFLTSLGAFHEAGDAAGTAEGFEGVAAVSAVMGEPSKAAALLGAAEETRAESRVAPHPFEKVLLDRFVMPAQRSVDQDAWLRAHETGRGLTREDAVILARATMDGSDPRPASYDRQT